MLSEKVSTKPRRHDVAAYFNSLGATNIHMRKFSQIPSEEDFVRAKQLMREREQTAARFKSVILSELSRTQPCHYIWVWMADDKCTVSYIFPTDEDLKKIPFFQITQTIIESAIKEGIEGVVVEYHSHEHIIKKYNGNYEKYFR